MESIKIDILNPQARKLLEELANLNLIVIRDTVDSNSSFLNLIERIRKNSNESISLEEITREVEAVRKKRHGK